MKLINITNNHPKLVNEQLSNTDAQMVKVYSLGQTTVIYTIAPTHKDLVIINPKRPIRDNEIDYVLQRTIKAPLQSLEVIHVGNFVEITQSLKKKRPTFVPRFS